MGRHSCILCFSGLFLFALICGSVTLLLADSKDGNSPMLGTSKTGFESVRSRYVNREEGRVTGGKGMGETVSSSSGRTLKKESDSEGKKQFSLISKTEETIPVEVMPPDKEPDPVTVERAFAYLGKDYEYIIGPGDVLRIELFGIPGSQTVRVLPDGTIALLGLGQIKVAGRSARQLEQELKPLFEKLYIDPVLTVTVENPTNTKVAIFGSVDKPGVYSVEANSTLLDLVANAGGLVGEGQLNRVQFNALVFRAGDRIIKVDLTKILYEGILSLNMRLYPRDIVWVMQSKDFVYVLGQVGKPGLYAYQKDMRVLEAITLAGSTRAGANLKKVYVIREENGRRLRYRVDMTRAIKPGSFHNMLLKPGDIVYVPTGVMANVNLTFQQITPALQMIYLGDQVSEIIRGED